MKLALPCTTPAFLLALAAVPLPAQNIWSVGAGQPFATIDGAIQSASPGDIIAVRAGSYAPFTIDRPVTIRSEPVGAAVTIAPSAVTSVDLHAGEHARLCGIDLPMLSVTPTSAGVLSVEDCSLVSPFGTYASPVRVLGGSVLFTRCRILDGLPAVYAVDASIAFVQCEVRGQSSPHYNASSSAVFAWSNCRVHASGSTFAAGTGTGLSMGWPGIWALQTSQFDMVDCVVTGGDYLQNSLPGGAALASGVDCTIRHHRCTLTPGTNPSGPGPTTSGNVIATPLLGAGIQEPRLLVGGSLTADFLAESGDLVVVLAAFALAPPTPAPLVAPLQWGFAGQSFVVDWRVADAAGHAGYRLLIPSNPMFRDVGVWLTGASLGGLPGRLSPPIGGVIR